MGTIGCIADTSPSVTRFMVYEWAEGPVHVLLGLPARRRGAPPASDSQLAAALIAASAPHRGHQMHDRALLEACEGFRRASRGLGSRGLLLSPSARQVRRSAALDRACGPLTIYFVGVAV
jgi:hypothetical protein